MYDRQMTEEGLAFLWDQTLGELSDVRISPPCSLEQTTCAVVFGCCNASAWLWSSVG